MLLLLLFAFDVMIVVVMVVIVDVIGEAAFRRGRGEFVVRGSIHHVVVDVIIVGVSGRPRFRLSFLEAATAIATTGIGVERGAEGGNRGCARGGVVCRVGAWQSGVHHHAGIRR